MGVAQIKMPQLGESVTEGTVEKWLKREGEFVKRDEPIVEVVTDKVNAEIPSPFEGTLVKIDAGEGQVVRVGAVIAQIETTAAAAAAAPAPATANAASCGSRSPTTWSAASPPRRTRGRCRKSTSPAWCATARRRRTDSAPGTAPLSPTFLSWRSCLAARSSSSRGSTRRGPTRASC